MSLLCGEKEYNCKIITVEKFRKYAEIMEKNNTGNSAQAIRFNMEIIKMLFRISEREILKATIEEQLIAAKTIHFVMQNIVARKFLELNPERPEQVEQEKSAFDEYDEENGYNDIELDSEIENEWTICKENIDRIIKLCIKAFNDSVTGCMQSDIMSLLEHIAFEIRTMHE